MKYLKTYEFFQIVPTEEKQKEIQKSKDLASQRREMMSEIVSEMDPKCEDVAQDITDIFQEWVDEGIEFEDVQLAMPSKDGDTISLYYPHGWEGPRSGKKYYHPSFGNDNTNKKIIKYLEKNKPYYEVTFGVDIFNKAKEIQQVRFGEIDYESEDIQHLFEIVQNCAEDMFNRLSSMYNIKVINSMCFLPYRDVNDNDMWTKCNPIPKEKTSKVIWLLEINK